MSDLRRQISEVNYGASLVLIGNLSNAAFEERVSKVRDSLRTLDNLEKKNKILKDRLLELNESWNYLKKVCYQYLPNEINLQKDGKPTKNSYKDWNLQDFNKVMVVLGQARQTPNRQIEQILLELESDNAKQIELAKKVQIIAAIIAVIFNFLVFHWIGFSINSSIKSLKDAMN